MHNLIPEPWLPAIAEVAITGIIVATTVANICVCAAMAKRPQ